MKSTVRQLAGALISASRGIGHAVGRAGSLQSDRFFDDDVQRGTSPWPILLPVLTRSILSITLVPEITLPNTA
jgi:hypothetical protein